jgi:katanin p60 ATPase-containing subunit A1
MSSLIAIRASADANSADQKRQQERKRNLLVIVNSYLIEQGYVEAAERLQAESGGILNRYAIADNLDMSTIITEYEAYYEMRFDKKPKFVRKLNEGEDNPVVNKKGAGTKKASGSSTAASNSSKKSDEKLPSINGSNPESDQPAFAVTGNSVTASADNKGTKKNNNSDEAAKVEERLLKPPPQFGGETELKQLANIISREIYQESPNVRFDDIIHLDEAKRLLVEAVQLPLRFPSLFTGILRPWRGILLHGPPGTGKTLLAKAVATECNTTFFNISASTLVSKWRGDSEKMVRVLFELARYHAPSTIFLDEIDSILTARDGEGGEHEASRRMKTELLIQMDGICSSHNSKFGEQQQVFVMAASNLPWDLDIALLRRLEKRVLVPLPSMEARELMVRKHLQDRSNDSVDFHTVAMQTEGYSGADLELVCREAAMMPVRRLIRKVEQLHVHELQGAVPEPPQKQSNSTKRPMAPVAIQTHLYKNSIQQQHDMEVLLKSDPVTMEDIINALSTTKPSSDGKIGK